MKRDYYLLGVWAIFLICCIACGKDHLPEDDDESGTIDLPVDTTFTPEPNDSVEWKDAVVIAFNGQSATITNPYIGKGVTVTQTGADVVVQSTTAAIVQYVLTGSTNEGSLKMYSQTQFELIMNGVDIVNSDDPALNIQSGKRVDIKPVEGTTNRLAGGMSFASEGGKEDTKAAFFSEAALIFSGKGSLEVISRYRHAICSDEFISIEDGNITVSMSARDGIHVNNYFRMSGGTLDINCFSDGIDSEGYITLTGGSIKIVTTQDKGNGIKAAGTRTVANTGTLTVDNGTIVIQTAGSESDGLKSKANLIINNGSITIDANYDCIKSTKAITINGGSIYCNSAINDGLDANETITVNGGTIVAVGSAGQEGFECGKNTFKITGGTLIGFAEGTSTPTASVSTQRSFVYSGASVSPNTNFNVTSKDGNSILTYVIPKSFSSNMTVLFSSPAIQNGVTYTISKGGEISGGDSFHGLYSNATYTGGTQLAEFTVSSMVMTIK